MGDDSVETQLALVKQSIVHLELDITEKHRQNRTSIHEIRGDLQKCVDLITGIRIANARWNIAAGIITAALVEGIRAIVSHLK